jgi:hypothetical protein
MLKKGVTYDAQVFAKMFTLSFLYYDIGSSANSVGLKEQILEKTGNKV